MFVPSQDQLYKRLGLSPAQLQQFCQQAFITELALFGSVLREDFRPDSDIDILIRLAPNPNLSLLDFIALKEQLKTLLHRDVDLLERDTVEADPNWIRRQEILNHA